MSNFRNEIDNILSVDNISPPVSFMLYGSSTFRLWSEYKGYFIESCVNAGFGGAKLSDLLLYEKELISKFAPKRTILYIGANDIVSRLKVNRLTSLVEDLSDKMSRKTQLYFLCTIYHPAFIKYFGEIKKLNDYLEYLSLEQGYGLIKSHLNKLDDASMFQNDKIHLNKKGYDLLGNEIKNYLI